MRIKKRSMFAGQRSDNVPLSQAGELQTRYVTLLTMSADFHRFLGDLLKHMEELKVRLMGSPVAHLEFCRTTVFIVGFIQKYPSVLLDSQH